MVLNPGFVTVSQGHSVIDSIPIDSIPKTPFSVQYVTIDAFVVGIIWHDSRGTLMAKFDVVSVY